jgi:hypothetical protein
MSDWQRGVEKVGGRIGSACARAHSTTDQGGTKTGSIERGQGSLTGNGHTLLAAIGTRELILRALACEVVADCSPVGIRSNASRQPLIRQATLSARSASAIDALRTSSPSKTVLASPL